MLRAIFLAMAIALVVVLLCFLTWMLFSSADFLHIARYTYDPVKRQFELVRRVEWRGDGLVAAWRTEAHGNGLDCADDGTTVFEKYETDRMGRTIVGPDGSPVEKLRASYPLSPQLSPCMSDHEATVVTTLAVMAGPVPLRPIILYIPPR